jgi:hypothetical protein
MYFSNYYVYKLINLPNTKKFEDAVRKAIGEDPPYPPSVIQMTSMPHKFKWLRKSSNKEGIANSFVDLSYDK